MNYIMPIKIQVSSDVELPFEIIDDGKIKLHFRKFETIEKSKLLGLKDLKIEGTKISHAPGVRHLSHNDDEDVIYCDYCFELECPQTERDNNMSFASSQMSLISRISLLLLAKRSECSFSFKPNGGIGSTRRPDFRCVPLRKPPELNLEYLDLFLKIYNEIAKLHKKERFEQLISLYELAQVTTNPQALKGSLFVTILESLFSTKDEKSELSYRFPLRMTKYLKGTYETEFRKIKDWYNSRSAYYHTGIDKFSNEDLLKLEELTSEIICKFLETPSDFDGKEFDRILLG